MTKINQRKLNMREKRWIKIKKGIVSKRERKKKKQIKIKGRDRKKGKRNKEREMASSNGSDQIFYELNCAGGLCPLESMCEDQTPRRGWFLPPSGSTPPPPSLAGRSIADSRRKWRIFATKGQKRIFRFPMIRPFVDGNDRHLSATFSPAISRDRKS